MPTKIAPRALPEVKHVLHRVYAHGDLSHGHESADLESAHQHAISASTAGPLHRYEVRGVPSHVPRHEKGKAPDMVPNTDGRYEVAVAWYQAGKQIPIT